MKKIIITIVFLLFTSPCFAGGKYLGKLSSDPYDSDSVSNPYGQYGSQYSPDSVNNPYGQYGSPYSNSSANNPYATEAPVLIERNGKIYIYGQ